MIELPRLVAVSRLKLTNLGIDPPSFNDDPDIAAHNQNDWVPNAEDVDQQWDDENVEDFIDEQADGAQPREPNRDNDHQNNDDKNKRDTAGREMEERNEDESDEIRQHKGQLNVKVRIAPPVRMTRSAARKKSVEYREVVKMLAMKTDESDNTLIKVLCRGDSRERAFWANRTALLGDDIEIMMRDIPKKMISVRKKPNHGMIVSA